MNMFSIFRQTRSIYKIAFCISFFSIILSCSNNLPDFSKNKNAQKIIKSIEFEELTLSKNEHEASSMRISPKLSISYSDGTKKDYPLSYHNMIKMGDKIGKGIFGLITDVNGEPITEKDGSVFISQDPDGNSFISKGNRNYLITHMESMPGAIYKTELQLKDHLLVPVNSEPIDLAAVDGTVINCASSKTPWGTHIGGEEDFNLNSLYASKASPYYQNCAVDDGIISSRLVSGVRSYFCVYVAGMQNYLKETTIDKTKGFNGDKFKPYNYGYTVEVGINSDGTTRVARHYVTGKYSPELGLMMPDNKTMYMSDDGNAKGFWKFVSDKKINEFSDNWQGTLYAAKVKQLSSKDGGHFSMGWIELGHSSDFEIKKMIDSKLQLTDIFDVAFSIEKKTCPKDFTRVFEGALISCLRLKKGQELAAAFLESRKYAAYLGATLEFRKEEGLAYNPASNKLYIAMTQIDGSMLDNYKKIETNNDIRLPENECGGIYELDLDNHFSAISMQAVLTGRQLKEDEKYADKHFCSPEKIANPDNLFFLGSNTLIISEDGIKHLNNMSWAYNTETKKITRIASLPLGAELTGVTNAVIGESGFLFMTQQHPYQDNPVNAKKEKIYTHLFEQANDDELNAIVGYIAGIPVEIFDE